uniref:MHC class I-like antigen recognition-like domain-containing protein n=1 Tax=Sus scrofa TaxID=9823 RepID=A0A8D0MFV2_PIG
MLFLHLAFLAVLLSGGDNTDADQEYISFYLIQISSFANQSWLQTHSWESELGTIISLHTWSKENFSNEKSIDLQQLFRIYFIRLTQEIQDFASQLQFGCKFNSFI